MAAPQQHHNQDISNNTHPPAPGPPRYVFVDSSRGVPSPQLHPSTPQQQQLHQHHHQQQHHPQQQIPAPLRYAAFPHRPILHPRPPPHSLSHPAAQLPRPSGPQPVAPSAPAPYYDPHRSSLLGGSGPNPANRHSSSPDPHPKWHAFNSAPPFPRQKPAVIVGAPPQQPPPADSHSPSAAEAFAADPGTLAEQASSVVQAVQAIRTMSGKEGPALHGDMRARKAGMATMPTANPKPSLDS
ncbi:hypothetical protein BDK51DRAFT_33543 [Blyttiomyces helicus]|uniref:Uncharacterized protein n=1 Tax=Blyttiomyces helicus TaxID=388810 RepID=A0A4P9VUX7_9FUNG|nr:hypothetical protein BDK51DRAFT_33543 [Blyttiomyces helicus]|eukprot:RKO83404.1 hypothetical protein BDK51DRAFT_33543 [Blyttiomyces helicus]